MGRSPSCDDNDLKKGPWTSEEDEKLVDYITKNGLQRWRTLPTKAGLNRCGKSCRLRWTNYLRPDIKRGKFSDQEQSLIIKLHSLLGNKWSRIATHLPGRTDNEIKNYWNTFVRKKLLKMGIDPTTHKPTTDTLNNLLNLSQLLTTPTQFSNPIMSPWDSTAQLVGVQLLQNLSQVINTNPLPPYYMENNTTTTPPPPPQLGSQTLNPFEGIANYNNSTNNNSPQIIPNYSWPYSNLEGVCANNNNIKSISGSYDHINLLENPISLPQLVSESPETSTANQMVNSNSDAAYLSTINASPEYSTTFEDLDKLMDDDTIYWKDIF